ncbi:MAG: hypothetical protein ACPLXC_02005 [Candidatus Pacearchaeota archaeon]
MTEYQCDSCAYRFYSERVTPPFRCPFCGKERTVNPVQSAEQIMSDIDNEAQERKGIMDDLERARQEGR